MMAQESGPMIRGRHVLFALLGLFGIVIAVNLVFVYLALDTFTGVSRDNPYQEGLAYNQVLAARDAQRDLGWQGVVSVTAAGKSRENLTVALTDRAGAPLTGFELTGRLRRPTHAGMDQPLSWQENAPGRYTSEVLLPARGNWDLEVTADDGRTAPFEMKARLWFE